MHRLLIETGCQPGALGSGTAVAEHIGRDITAVDVDAGLHLPADHVGDGGAQAIGVSLPVVGLAGLLGADKLQERRRPDKAAYMCSENATGGCSGQVTRNCSSESGST